MNKQRSRRIRRKFNLRASAQNLFDNLMTRGVWAKLLVMCGITMAFVALAALVVRLFFSGGKHYGESLWSAFVHVLDPGVLAGTDGNTGFMAVMLVVTIFGMLYTSTLIGVMNTGINEEIDKLGEGYSRVMTRYRHVLILGYREITPTIVAQLQATAARRQINEPIVVLAHGGSYRRLVEELGSRNTADDRRGVLCRQGEIFDPADLERCDIAHCSAIIIAAENDFETIKAILACTETLNRLEREGKLQARDMPIFAALEDDSNEPGAWIAGGGQGLSVLSANHLIATLVAESGRTTGISAVYGEMLGAGGICFGYIPRADVQLPDDCGKLEANLRLKNATLLGGIPRGQAIGSLSSWLFPTDGCRTLGDYDQLLVMYAEGTSPETAGEALGDPALIRTDVPAAGRKPVHMVILGCNHLLEEILTAENGHFTPAVRAQITIAANTPAVLEINGKAGRWPHLELTPVVCDPRDPYALRALLTPDVHSVVVLPDRADGMESADQSVISKLLFLRAIRDELPEAERFRLTCVIHLEENRKVVEMLGVEDLILVSSLAAKAASRIAHEPLMGYMLYEMIMQDAGSELHRHPVTDFLRFAEGCDTVTADWFTLIRAAAAQNEVPIGYSRMPAGAQAPELILNPPRYDKGVMPYEFRRTDEIIVIAQ